MVNVQHFFHQHDRHYYQSAQQNGKYETVTAMISRFHTIMSQKQERVIRHTYYDGRNGIHPKVPIHNPIRRKDIFGAKILSTGSEHKITKGRKQGNEIFSPGLTTRRSLFLDFPGSPLFGLENSCVRSVVQLFLLFYL